MSTNTDMRPGKGAHSGKKVNYRKSRGRKRRILLCVLIAIFVVVVAAFTGFLVVKAMGRASLVKKAEIHVPSLISDVSLETGAEEEGVVYRNGKKYRYNQSLITVLCMGIDSREENLEAGEMGSGGQSDANFLLVIDEANHRLSVIAIPRDTMTDIDLYDMHGQYFDTVPAQLALQYAYGDGGELSCELMEKAVSNLMYGLPIHAYVSINMNAIQVLNDAVGGLTVEALEDISKPGLSVKKGKSVTLTGEQARTYVRTRNTEENYSAVSRLQRQKQYLLAFISKAFSAVREDLTLPLSMFHMITDYMVTDISASEVTYLATAAIGCSFTGDSFYTLPGEQRLGDYYEEFYMDEDALYDLILEVFYIEETDLE